MVIMDDADDLAIWPNLLERYCLSSLIDGPRMLTGTPLTPRYVLERRCVLVPEPGPAGKPELRPCPR